MPDLSLTLDFVPFMVAAAVFLVLRHFFNKKHKRSNNPS